MTGYRARFDSGDRLPFRIGANNLPVFAAPSGYMLPLALATPEVSLHANPSFENVTGSTPDDWEFFWENGGCTVASDTTEAIEAERALTVNVATAGQQIVLSSVFDMLPGDVLKSSIWARGVSGQATMTLAALMSQTETPDVFGAATLQSELPAVALSDEYTQYQQTFAIIATDGTVPPLTPVSVRVFFRVSSADALAAVARLDLTSTALVGTSATAPA